MAIPDILTAALLGVVEGITEFLPISSTGHLILLVDLLGFKGPPGRVFEVVIQLGAILGVCWVYRERLVHLIYNPTSQGSMRLLMIIGIGFLPSAAIGFLAHGFIKSVLFSPLIVSFSLVAGGVAIIFIERLGLKSHVHHMERITAAQALKIGLCQALAMIPGTSRSGATIMGGLVFGLDRRTAAEFSFLLAIPTMFAASGYDLYRNVGHLNGEDAALLVVGFGTALVSSVLSVGWLVSFVSRHQFTPFGWYRIILGIGMAALLLTAG